MKKTENGGSVMSDGKFKLRGFPPIDKVELRGLYDDFKENFSSKIERFTKHLNKVHNSKLRLIDIKELMDYAKMNFVSKGGMVEYHDYKGVEIMYEPTYEEYFVNDEVFNSMESAKRHIDYMEKSNGVIIDYYNGYDINIYPKLNEYWVNDEIKFNSMEDAKNYIDTGEANETPTYIQNLYRRGAMAKGGSVKNGYMVFNYTDNLYATNEIFKTKNDAKRFIDEFKKRFVLQGY